MHPSCGRAYCRHGGSWPVGPVMPAARGATSSLQEQAVRGTWDAATSTPPPPVRRISRRDRFERVVGGFKVAVWTQSHGSVFGTEPGRRVCQVWFGTRIGPDGIQGEVRRSVDHLVKSLAGSGRRWLIIDRRPESGGVGRSGGIRLPRYFALTAATPEHVRLWLTNERRRALIRTVATTLTPFDVRFVARRGSEINDHVITDLLTAARRLI